MAIKAEHYYDCIVVGSGHAGSCAALAAIESGRRRVLIVDKAPREWAGGNGYFTAGAHRTVHNGLDDLLPIVSNVSPEKAAIIDMQPYTAGDFTNDIMRLSDHRSDPSLVKALVENSRDAIGWLAQEVGVPFVLSFNRQAFEVDGRQKFWGGMVLSVVDGGKGLIAAHERRLEATGVETWYDSCVTRLLTDEGSVCGVAIDRGGKSIDIRSRSVVLASGGFEASSDLRKKYLGDGWNLARVRGTPYNTGDGLSLAKSIGAAFRGDFSPTGCHNTCWDASAALDTGDRFLSNQFTKSGYPLGLMVNKKGLRFVDEGADFRNYTYAKYGRAILHQPGGVAFQVFDNQAYKFLREEEYGDGIVKKIFADTVKDLAQMLVTEGLENPDDFVATIQSYNHSVRAYRSAYVGSLLKWDPAVKDGLTTASDLSPPKSNWALPIQSPPFLAVKVACGITFTFGGLAIDPDTASVLREDMTAVIPGLFCAGELVGGLFYGNYPGGSGLTAGAVFGRKAGKSAGEYAKVLLGTTTDR